MEIYHRRKSTVFKKLTCYCNYIIRLIENSSKQMTSFNLLVILMEFLFKIIDVTLI